MQTVYLSSELRRQHPTVFEEMSLVFWWNETVCKEIESKNLWVRDWMPVKTKNGLVKFRYDPTKYRKPVPRKCWSDFHPKLSKIYLDGGNVEQSKDKVLMTEMVLVKNPKWDKLKLIDHLTDLFGKRIVLLPIEPEDTLGHVDGMARFSANGRVIINDYSVMRSKVYTKFQRKLERVLCAYGFDPIVMPYAYNKCPHLTNQQFHKKYPYGDDNNPAVGYYINALILPNLVLVPQFNLKADSKALEFFHEHFPNRNIKGIECFDLSQLGGLLNCVSYQL
jgi:agmatine deiminase